MGGDKKQKRKAKTVPARRLKKHTRSLKETGIIYAIGSVISIYFGLLCGAVWMSGNNFNEFLINFNDFILLKHHFIVGVTDATLPFIGTYWVMFSLIFIMIATRFEHPFAGQEFGVAKWGNAKDFTRDFANHDEDAIVVVNTGDSGECAIVIKGTDPLYEPKCKMEVTPFLKLLCRKNKPYDPKRRRAERAKEKTVEPFFYAGEDAVKKAEVLRGKGTYIVSLSMNDIENMVIAGKLRETTTALKMTEEMQKTLHENHERYIEEHCDLPELDYEQYRDEGPYSEESQKKFQNRCLVVTELDSAGYTRQQIKMLHKLIMQDIEVEKIKKIFPPSTEMEKIKNIVKKF